MQEVGSLQFCNEDVLPIKGQFGLIFKGKLHQTLDVAVEKVDQKYFRIHSDSLFPPPNHPNIARLFIEADVEYL